MSKTAPKTTTPHLDRLAELEADVERLEAAEDAARDARRTALTAVRDTRAELAAEFERLAPLGESTSPRVEELTARLAAAQTEADLPHEQRAEGASAAAYAARQAVQAYKAEHFEDFLAELKPEAEGAVERIRAAVAEIEAARRAYSEVRAKVTSILPAGLDGQAIPAPELPKVVGAVEKVVPPLPAPAWLHWQRGARSTASPKTTRGREF